MPEHENSRLHGTTTSNRNGHAFSCPQCNSKFNRLAHLRRHQMTHGSEKPYNCRYCPVASSRKDVIVRHTRNFHPGAPIIGTDGRRKRRNTSHLRSPVSVVPGNELVRASSNGERGEGGDDSEGPEDAVEEICVSPASNEIDGSQASLENQLDNLLPSHTDMFTSSLQENHMDFDTSLVDPELVNYNFSEVIDLDILLSNAQELFGGLPSYNASGLLASVLEPPRPSLPDTTHDEKSTEHILLIKEKDCSRALENLAKYPNNLVAHFPSTSKYAVRRFVKAFFEHVAPLIPLVHEPTFDLATVPSPLLLAIMACGAAYLSEHPTSASFHTVATGLMSEHERRGASWNNDSQLRIWMLQTYVLLSYFAVHCRIQGKATDMLVQCINRSLETLSDRKTYPVTSYKDWVLQETMNRCIASTILIAASLGSNYREQCFASSLVDAKFVLPCSIDDWRKDEVSWKAPTQILHSDQALKSILAGEPLDLPVSEFGLVTIISAILYQVCSFESLTSSHHLELYTNLGEKMGRSVQVLDEMVVHRMNKVSLGLPPDPIMQRAKSLLNSVYYHLYASVPLATMKRMLWSPATLDGLEDILSFLNESSSKDLYKALFRAADQFRFDCRLGLKYLRKIAPLRFGPECAISSYEGGLLLCWYFQFAHSRLSQPESCNALRALIDEGFAEIEELRLEVQGQLATLPLAVAVELLSDGSIWKWPISISNNLDFLIKRFKAGDLNIFLKTAS